MALDEATTTFLTQMSESGMPPIHEMTPEQARGLGGMLREMYGPGPDMARVDDEQVPVAGGSVPVCVLVPSASARGVIVYYHGGGWVIGTIDEFDTMGRELARRTGCAVVLVDYRLAPEYRYPTAVDDSWAALLWADEHREQIAGSAVPLVVAGDSAGGNLSAIMTQRAHRRGGPDIALQVLVYPVTDADLDTGSYVDPANQLMLSRDSMIWFWDHYVPDVATRAEPDASPNRAGDLAGLPPAVSSTWTGSRSASATCARGTSRPSRRPGRPRTPGSSTSPRSGTSRSTRTPTPGTWARTFPASRGCSCPTSAGSASTGSAATRSPPGATRGSF